MIPYKNTSRIYALLSHITLPGIVYSITGEVLKCPSPSIKPMKKILATMALAVLAFAPAFAADEAEGTEVVYVAGMTGVT